MYSNGQNVDDLKTFMEKVEKQKLDNSKKTLKKGETMLITQKSLPPKTTFLSIDPKRVSTELSSSIANKVLVLEDKK